MAGPTHNIGKIERIIRFIVALIILGWGILFHNWWGLIGIFPWLTARFGWCPLYALLKFSTVKRYNNGGQG
ncbi:MAG: DUF2892 domain-containing protein [Candidatus Electryoneaceae bacterium]|nr:DUF2892 domain-containing protein [Candidatus Electryoneaceae bacterium]